MNEMVQMNTDSWKLAVSAMIENNGKVEPYSTSQIRKMMGALKSPDYLRDMNKIITDYEPASPQGAKPHLKQKAIREKREKNNSFGEKLLKIGQDHDTRYMQRLLKYTLWNIKIIEQYRGDLNKLSLVLDCEGVDKKNIFGEPELSTNNTKKHNDLNNRNDMRSVRQTYRDFRRK